MSVHSLQRELWIPQPIERVFDFFSRASNLERITPPLVRFRLLTPEPIVMKAGTRIEYRLRIHGIPTNWLTEIADWRPPHQFVDEQLEGPYKLWRHTHTFSEERGGTRMVDEVRYELPFGALGNLAQRLLVRRDIDDIFAYRNQRIPELIK